ncbi:MAG: alpha/beta hydrolase [Verrucomicrobiota bacterium]
MANGVIESNKPALRPRVFWMLFTILGIYVLVCIGVCLLQRGMLYFPTRMTPEITNQMAARKGMSPWRNSNGQIIGWKLPSNGESKGSVLLVHGNAGSALDRSDFAAEIHQAAPVDVYLLEYPGYGAREGSPNQKSLLAAADEGFELLTNSGPVYVVSESLGTGVAAHLARQHGKAVAGLMLFVPYDNLASVAQAKMPFLPVRLMLWDRFDPAAWLENYSGPVGFVLAENDEVIPAKFGQRLHDGFAGPKKLEIIPGARHNDVFSQSPKWWKNIFTFWENHSNREKAQE